MTIILINMILFHNISGFWPWRHFESS